MAEALHLGDSHEFIKTLPDNSIDLVCTDPPYHTTQLAFDALEVRWSELWPEIYRVCKPSAQMVFFSAQPFTTALINSNPKDFRVERIWVKTRKTGHLHASWRPLQQHENILVFCRKPTTATYNPQRQSYEGPFKGAVKRKPEKHCRHYGHQTKEVTGWSDDGTRQPTTVMHYKSVQRDGDSHPSQKNLECLKELVLTYTNPGDTVLDLFSGSFTTGVACLLTGRRFVGCEIDPQYFEIGKKRMEATAAQSSLFEVAS